ncbi:MAG: ABC transporter ATP-binding protein [Candidatus Kariarchaeaceae archaeon]
MKQLFKMLIPYIKQHKKNFFFLNITSIALAVTQTFFPLQVGILVDDAIALNDKSGLYLGITILLGLAIMDLTFNVLQRLSATRFGQRIIENIRNDLYETLQYQEMEFYAFESVGQIMSRTIEEVMSLSDVLRWAYRITLLLIWLVIGAVIAMWGVSPYMALIFVVIVPVILIIIRKTSKKNQEKFYQARYVYGVANQYLAENLSGIKTIKSFGREKEQIDGFRIKTQDYIDATMRTMSVRAVLREGMIFLISMAIIGLLLLGGGLVFEEVITVGEFVAFMLLVMQISIPGRWVGFVGIIVQDANAAAIRLNELFNAPNPLADEQGTIDLEDVDGSITFDNLSFSYPNGTEVLTDINLHIPAGQKVALLGPNGSGKSTLINLLPRLFDPTKGRIMIDKFDLHDLTLKSIRDNLGVVHQESFLFSMTLHDNIAFSRPKATREEVVEAAKAAHIHDFIATLEEGYDTIVGERGVTLSGGQRQRIAIARTLLKNPPILIFDDSVSAVDPETEGRIQESLECASKERTSIIISQRPSSLQYVDRIIVIDEGKIVQDGSDKELRGKKGIYQDFIDAVKNQIKYMSWDENLESEGKQPAMVQGGD